MANPNVTRRDNRDLIFLTVFFAMGLVLFELGMAICHHPNIRSQHLGGAVAYAKGHIDLLRPMLLGFTVNGTPTPLEFPIWQVLTAVLMKCFGLWYGWGNVMALIFFFSSLWPLFDLCRRLGSSRVGWWAIVFTMVQPLSWLVGGQAGGDSAAWAFALWFIYASQRMMSEGKWGWWLFSLVAASLSAATKAPFFMAAGLTTFFWLCLSYRRSRRAWFFLVSSGIVGILFFLGWDHHCHQVYAEADFATQSLNVFDKDGVVRQWYFKSLGYRLTLGNWLRGGWHLANCVLAGNAFVLLLLIGTRVRKSAEPWLGLLAAFCTTLVFTGLICEHRHYFFIFSSVIAWLCALAATEVESGIWDRLRISILARTGILVVTFTVSLIGALSAIHVNELFDPYIDQVGRLIEEHTAPEEKVVVWGMNWGDPFLNMNRQGFTGGFNLDDSRWLNDPQRIKRLKELGYTKIVLLNPSPLAVALTAATVHVRGHNAVDVKTLANLHEHLPTVAKDWPVVFDSPQMLIVRIPDSLPGT